MLSIDMKFIHGILMVDLDGELVEKNKQKIERHLTNLIKDNGIKYVLLNLNNVLDIDKSGILSIVENYKAIKENNGKLVLCGINKLLENMNRIKLDDYVYEINDIEEAYNLVEDKWKV